MIRTATRKNCCKNHQIGEMRKKKNNDSGLGEKTVALIILRKGETIMLMKQRNSLKEWPNQWEEMLRCKQIYLEETKM